MITVGVRLRPPLGPPSFIRVGDNTVTVMKPIPYSFSFDCVFGAEESSEVSIHSRVGEPIIYHALQGYNACFVTYGCSQTGKSSTLLGCRNEEQGVLGTILEDIFGLKQAEARIWISFLEVCDDDLRDLLSPERDPWLTKSLEVVEHPVVGVMVPGLSEVACKDMTDVERLLDFGMCKRVICAETANSVSASHTIITIKMECGEENGEKRISKIHLVDLASKKVGFCVNESIQTFERVFKPLIDGQKISNAEVQFRACKLTHLLKDAFFGNCKTYFLAFTSGVEQDVEQTVATLQFAEMIKKVMPNTKIKANERKEFVAQQLQGEIAKLNERTQSDEIKEEIRWREKFVEDLVRKRFERHYREAKMSNGLRERTFESWGVNTEVSLNRGTPDSHSESAEMPFLTNMSDDMQLAGALVYNLKPGSTTTIGSSGDIVLCGLGMTQCPILCAMRVAEGGTSVVLVPTKNSRVLVNGESVVRGETELFHLDRIICGWAMCFQLHVPLAPETPAGKIPATYSEAILELQPAESACYKELEGYDVDDVYARWSDLECTTLLELRAVCQLVDEANRLSQVVRPSDGFKFEVEFSSRSTSYVEDELFVRVVKTRPKREFLYYWGVEKFAQRLQQMRNCFGAMRRNQWSPNVDSLTDPWYEASFSEVREALRVRKMKAIQRMNEMALLSLPASRLVRPNTRAQKRELEELSHEVTSAKNDLAKARTTIQKQEEEALVSNDMQGAIIRELQQSLHDKDELITRLRDRETQLSPGAVTCATDICAAEHAESLADSSQTQLRYTDYAISPTNSTRTQMRWVMDAPSPLRSATHQFRSPVSRGPIRSSRAAVAATAAAAAAVQSSTEARPSNARIIVPPLGFDAITRQSPPHMRSPTSFLRSPQGTFTRSSLGTMRSSAGGCRTRPQVRSEQFGRMENMIRHGSTVHTNHIGRYHIGPQSPTIGCDSGINQRSASPGVFDMGTFSRRSPSPALYEGYNSTRPQSPPFIYSGCLSGSRAEGTGSLLTSGSVPSFQRVLSRSTFQRDSHRGSTTELVRTPSIPNFAQVASCSNLLQRVPSLVQMNPQPKAPVPHASQPLRRGSPEPQHTPSAAATNSVAPARPVVGAPVTTALPNSGQQNGTAGVRPFFRARGTTPTQHHSQSQTQPQNLGCAPTAADSVPSLVGGPFFAKRPTVEDRSPVGDIRNVYGHSSNLDYVPTTI
eukprot:GEMP01001595.1.p1 GENE.GEMP01001595.1~~GEMP01001595.1.p1  ORF type:complete len:1206 (+),score=242.93 GEMP01001595.1:99-3716(+)